jgi:hypothetical protein
MASFRCPQCHADVTLDPGEWASGCPCCGYAQDMAAQDPVPYVPYVPLIPAAPSIPYTPPSSPWPGTTDTPWEPWVGDPPWQTTTDKYIYTTGTGTTSTKILWDGTLKDVSTGVVTLDSSQLKDMQFSWTN